MAGAFEEAGEGEAGGFSERGGGEDAGGAEEFVPVFVAEFDDDFAEAVFIGLGAQEGAGFGPLGRGEGGGQDDPGIGADFVGEGEEIGEGVGKIGGFRAAGTVAGGAAGVGVGL